jgi:cyanophycinase-like exopeptidase
LTKQSKPDYAPGPVVLFGSGETSSSGRKAFDQVMRRLSPAPRVVLLETPAGFELNSSQVIGRVAEFIDHRLQNYNPQTQVVPARKRGTPFSPDDDAIVAPLLDADLIFMGPGSPTYAVRQLQDSLAWYYTVARHRLGAALVLASAAAIAISLFALPVYEIYKVGEDLLWKPGLDFFGAFGLPLIFIPHWNNNDGGEELDTSRCFMGQPRFARLIEMLPADLSILGIDENTALIMNLHEGTAEVVGSGGVTLIHTGHQHPSTGEQDLSGTGLDEIARLRKSHVHQYASGETFPLSDCCPVELPEQQAGIPSAVWERAKKADLRRKAELESQPDEIPAQVHELVEERQAARERKDWQTADQLREQIAELGWQVMDTPEGPQLESQD